MEILENKMEKPKDMSLYIFDSEGKIRILITELINDQYYNSFLNAIIALSTLMLMLDEP